MIAGRNPLRALGIARILAGIAFVANGASTLRQYNDLIPQAARLFGADVGATDAPIRSLLMLILSPLLVMIGLLLIARGFAWVCRIPMSAEGPPPLDRDEVIAALTRRELPAFGDGGVTPPWPLPALVADELANVTWWRRDVMSRALRAFASACIVAVVVAGVSLAVRLAIAGDLLGPFPGGFVFTLPVVTGIWAAIGLLLLTSIHPRAESVELPIAADERLASTPTIIEREPRLLPREPAAVGLTLGIIGVIVQCLLLFWWNLSYVGFPNMATSIIRDAGSIIGGLVFLAIGQRMIAGAVVLLSGIRYESMLIAIDEAVTPPVARAAAIRTERLGPDGPRLIVAAVGGTYVRESVEQEVVSLFGTPSARWAKPQL
ncbi:MAG TPA: hypothetical protein VGM20_01995 [Gemmatimonadales bacterium]